MNESWIAEARRGLLERARGDKSWGYQLRSRGEVEPTALAALSLEAAHALAPSVDETESRREQAAVSDALAWLASHQGNDGAVRASMSTAAGEPVWATPLALRAWSVSEDFAEPRRRAVAWLLNRVGKIIPKDSPDVRIVGHDLTIVGWPWVEQTHAWLEPTAYALIALRGEAIATHPRIEAGLRLIDNRALPSGGWNYGNSLVLGRALRPQPAPTGVALVALAGQPRTPTIDRALAYLQQKWPMIEAPASMSWSVLGLDAWGKRPRDADSRLARTFQAIQSRDDAATRLALLLLAGLEGSAGFLMRGPTR